MGDVSVPFDWKPGDAVISIDNSSSRYIGIVVEKSLRKNWNLFIEGDENNLPKILKTVKKIDIFR